MFLDLPEIKHSGQAPHLLDQFREHSQALAALGHPMSYYDGLATAIIMRKLSIGLKRRFEDFRGANTDYPKIAEVVAFLEKECINAEQSAPIKRETEAFLTTRESSPKVNKPSSKAAPESRFGTKPSSSGKRSQDTNGHKATKATCPCCSAPHPLYLCPQFRTKDVSQRREFLQTHQRCFNCLQAHFSRDCTSESRCRVCRRKHHTMLHEGGSEQIPESNSQDLNTKRSVLLGTSQTNSTVMFATIQLRIKNRKNSILVRGVLDSAPQGSFITTQCAQKLGLPFKARTNALSGIAGAKAASRGRAVVTLTSANHKIIAKEHDVIVIDKITDNSPTVPIASTVRHFLYDLHLADPTFDRPGPIDLLLGADLFPRIMTGKPRPLGPSMPTVYETSCCYVLMGPAPAQIEVPTVLATSLIVNSPSELNSSIQKFWQLEEVGRPETNTNPEDPAELLFQQTTRRDSSGRFFVRLPFSDSPTALGDSKTQALQRFRSLERKCRAQPPFRDLYVQFMRNYEADGFMSPASANITDGPHCFLPHHGVVKETSSTTKLRQVFDGSAKTSTGVSLNQILHPALSLTRDIRDVLLNFRRHKVVLGCDIRQMYLQVFLEPQDRCWHLIFWRPSEDAPLKIYQLNTVTFGITSSAFLSMRSLRQLAIEHREEFPRAARIILEDSYVDDIATGADSLIEAKEDRDELTALLAKGNFSLRKWISNEPSLLDGFPKDHLEVPVTWEDQTTSTFSILGLQWIPSIDSFTYRIHPADKPPTKRGILSIIATIFDPLGWLSPVVFLAKSFMQQLWSQQVGWDDPLPSDFLEKWNKLLKLLPSLMELRIARHICDNGSAVQLHGFSDASEQGYAACVYVRSDLPPHSTHLVMAKSKVAPLTRVSVPRLELSAAHLLTNLKYYAYNQLKDQYQITPLDTNSVPSPAHICQ